MPSVLIIDDDLSVLRFVQRVLGEANRPVVTARTAADGLVKLREVHPDVLFLNNALPDANGMELALRVKQFDNKLPIVVLSPRADSATAIEAMKAGAYDYMVKPLDKQRIVEVVERALESRRAMRQGAIREPAKTIGEGSASSDVLVGSAANMVEVYRQVARIAGQDVPVLIRGESGTGKRLIARAIHGHSHRRDGRFQEINCAAVSENLLDLELFGQEQGAFDGTGYQRIGAFQQCDGGTIFLNEIGELCPAIQKKVLRVLLERRVERVGGVDTIETDVRLVSSTSRNLEEMIDAGCFRRDLLHRLNAFEIVVPPLRQRREDVPLLVEHFLSRFNKTLGTNVTAVSPEAMTLLVRHSWPGNVQELQVVLRKAMLMANGPVLVPKLIADEVQCRHSETESSEVATKPSLDLGQFVADRKAAGSQNVYAETLEWMERYLISRILADTQANQSKAAEELGITRGSLRHKIRSLGIAIDPTVSGND